jgi:hypothetical protein
MKKFEFLHIPSHRQNIVVKKQCTRILQQFDVSWEELTMQHVNFRNFKTM